ncbi:transmembrane protein 218-like [Athalia rosae]|uniref:transmembrane protein 218-like n=1 Tax=Athalia rosae TaxID=37344 RepID=UPI0006262445|nr:transmembrane protein 218-like [Athalia rosae]
MTTLVFGVGFGIFLILILWLSAGLICLISLRTQKKVGFIALGVVGIITIALISIPRSSENSGINTNKPYDQLFIWRTLLTVLLAGSAFIVLLAYIKFELMTPVKAVRLRSWIL